MSSFFTDILSGLAVALYGLKGGYTKINVKGQSIRIAIDNFRTLQRAKTYSIKEPDTLDWLDSFEPGSCFFDLGANIGQYSLYPAKKYGNDIQVYSFEPQCANYYLLNKNIYLNKLEKNITSYCVAVSGEEGFSKLYIPKFYGGGNRSQFGKEDLKNMKVAATHIQGIFGVTLDDLCAKWGFPYPNYMKIDVDGIEIPIIKGAENVLKNPALKSVIVELGTPEEQEEAVSLMEQAGLKVKFKTTRNWGETCFIFAK
jgi:FkbM family methyltransferase